MAFGDVTAWIATANTSWVATAQGSVAHPSDNVPLYYRTNFPYTGYPTGASTGGFLGMEYRRGFAGGYAIDRAFAGQVPGDTAAAVNCCWNHARKGRYGRQWWSADLSADASDGAGGTCAPLPGAVASASDSPLDDIGAWASSTVIDAGGHQTVGYTVTVAVMRLYVHGLLSQFGPDGGRGLPTDNPFTMGDLEWEHTTPTLLGIDLAPDENADTTNYTDDGAGINWYVDVPPNPEQTGGTWGPWMEDVTQFEGASDGPEAFIASLDSPLMMSYPGHAPAGWVPLGSDTIAEAKAREVATGDGSPGLRAVGLVPDIFSSTPTPNISGLDVAAALHRAAQVLALRIRFTPARHRWIDTTPDPPPELEGTGDIARSATYLSKGGYWT